MKNIKKIAVAAFIFVVGATIYPQAAIYVSSSLTGTNASTGYVMLGSGTKYVRATGTSGSGTVKAKRIVKYLPDSTMASFTVTNGNTGSSSFTAQLTTSSGDWQSYYINWAGNSSTASADVSFTD